MTQAFWCGLHASAVNAVLDHLASQRVIQRLWNRDTTLWSSDAQVQSAIHNRLGWLRIADVMAAQAEPLRTFTQEIRQAGFTHALLLGMGGSGLFAEVCRNTFGAAPGHPDLTVLDTTDPEAVRRAGQQHPPRQLLAIVSSKSGSTSEVSALSKYFYEQFRQANGNPGSHCIAITDAGTPLEAQAAAGRFRRTFVHGPENGADVGGRFSALTYFGLVPAALLGIDVRQLLARAQQMWTQCGPAAPIAGNPAAQLGAAMAALAQVGRDKLTLLCSPALSSFGTWVEQLIAENLGKQGKGIAPILGEPMREPSGYSADRLFVELQLASQPDPAVDRLVQGLNAAGHPVIRIQWADRYDLGGEVAKWEVASALVGYLMGINPFDEPNVKESKDRTKALLLQYARDGRFATEQPLVSHGDLAIYGSLKAAASSSPSHSLSVFFRQRRPTDYVAVLSFLPRRAALDQAVSSIRNAVAAALGNATMLGFGPRYLHSTGQLFKGGTDTGLFLLLTSEECRDLPIPGEPFTFGVLKQAQALGDFQAMQQHGRRVLRVHLKGDLDAAVRQLAAAIDEAALALTP